MATQMKTPVDNTHWQQSQMTTQLAAYIYDNTKENPDDNPGENPDDNTS
jgi:hypothetical protein